jgi:hypothetical protein
MAEWKYSPTVLNLVTKWDWLASRPGQFIPKERALGTHWIGDRRLGGPQRRSGRRGEEKSLASTGNQTPVFLRRQAYSASLYLLKYSGFSAKSLPSLTDFLEPFMRSL